MTTEIVKVEETAGLAEISPEDFDRALSMAAAKATSLKKVVDANGLAARINGKEYLKVEAWMTIAAGYEYTAWPEWTRQTDGIWEARVVVYDRNGRQVGAGESQCGSYDDGHWNTAPENARRSMAQTRAISKAYRSCLSWVVILAGYSPTPFEEMEHVQREETQKARVVDAPRPQAPQEYTSTVSEKQVKFIKDLADASQAAQDLLVATLDGRGISELEKFEAGPLIDEMKAQPRDDNGGGDQIALLK